MGRPKGSKNKPKAHDVVVEPREVDVFAELAASKGPDAFGSVPQDRRKKGPIDLFQSTEPWAAQIAALGMELAAHQSTAASVAARIAEVKGRICELMLDADIADRKAMVPGLGSFEVVRKEGAKTLTKAKLVKWLREREEQWGISADSVVEGFMTKGRAPEPFIQFRAEKVAE